MVWWTTSPNSTPSLLALLPVSLIVHYLDPKAAEPKNFLQAEKPLKNLRFSWKTADDYFAPSRRKIVTL